jgi:hypothetical protein
MISTKKRPRKPSDPNTWHEIVTERVIREAWERAKELEWSFERFTELTFMSISLLEVTDDLVLRKGWKVEYDSSHRALLGKSGMKGRFKARKPAATKKRERDKSAL